MQSPSRKTVLILGARGRFGAAAARAYAGQGWHVMAQMRPGALLPKEQGVTWLAVAPEDTDALVQAAHGASVVIHALNPRYTDWQAQAMPLLEAGLRVASRLNALFMLPGNVYNFGADMPTTLREDTPQQSHTRKGRIRIAMEQRMRQEAESGGVRSVVIRAGDFFGSGTGSWFDEVLVKKLQQGRMGFPGGPDVPTAWAYLPDLANAFVRVADRLQEEAHGQARFTQLHFEGHQLSGREWSHLLAGVARDLGWMAPEQALKVDGVPWPLIRLGAPLVPMWRELTEMRYLWKTPHGLAGERLAALIGPESRTPLLLAIRRSLQALGRTEQPGCTAPAWA